MDVRRNKSLQNFIGLNHLDKIGRNLRVSQNELLQDLSGFDTLTSVAGSVDFYMNPNLVNFAGAEKLQEIGSFLRIWRNNKMRNLDGFERVESINGYLEINDNDVLTDIMGISNIDYQTIDILNISGQPNLSFCGVASVCEYLNLGTNQAYITGNGNGCGSTTEVQNSCPTCVSVSVNDWVGTNGNWMEPSNWSAGRIPEICDDVTISNGREVKILLGEMAKCYRISVDEGAILEIEKGGSCEIGANE